MGAPNPNVTALVQNLALQHWTVANTPDLTGVIAAVSGQLSRLGGEINPPLVAFANAQLDALFAAQEATESAHGSGVTATATANIGTGQPINSNVLLQVSANANKLPNPAASAIVQIANADGLNTEISLEAYGGTAFPLLRYRKARGTAAIPLPIESGDSIGGTFYTGRRPAGFISSALFSFTASENWTDTATGTDYALFVTPIGTAAVVEKFRLRGDGAFILPAGNSTGTPGNATINLATGRSAIAAGASTVTITNSLVSATSIVFVVLQTNDATAILKNVVPGAGSFVVNTTAAVTGNTNFGWWTINT